MGGSEQQQRGRVRSAREKIPRKDGDRAKGKKGSNQRKKEMSKEKRGIVPVEGLAVTYCTFALANSRPLCLYIGTLPTNWVVVSYYLRLVIARYNKTYDSASTSQNPPDLRTVGKGRVLLNSVRKTEGKDTHTAERDIPRGRQMSSQIIRLPGLITLPWGNVRFGSKGRRIMGAVVE